MSLLFYFIFGSFMGMLANICVKHFHETKETATPIWQCENCGNLLSWKDCIPIFSYLFLKGRCRNCHCALPLHYPFVEFFTGICFLAIAVSVPTLEDAALFMFLTWLFIVATVSDILYREIPDELHLIGFVFLFIYAFLYPLNPWDIALGIVFPAFFLLLFSTIVEKWTKESVIGGGDIKFLMTVGALMGWEFATTLFVSGTCLLFFIFFAVIWQNKRVGESTYAPMMIGFSMAYFLMFCATFLS